MELVKHHIRSYRENFKTDIANVNISGRRWSKLDGKRA